MAGSLFIHAYELIGWFACLSSDWATTTGRLLGPTTCLPHEDGGISLNALLNDTASKLPGLFSTLCLFAERQIGKL